MTTATHRARAWDLLADVADPELPVVSVLDLGIVRAVDERDAGRAVRVTMTPTYSGCPATTVIARDIDAALSATYDAVDVRVQLSPAWSTEWISDAGRRKLQDAGVAPPHHAPLPLLTLAAEAPSGPRCPRCGSHGAEQLSEFGPSPCLALWRCAACREPFEAVKPR